MVEICIPRKYQHNLSQISHVLLPIQSVGKTIYFVKVHKSEYCKTLNICGIKLLPSNENDILAYLNFGCHDLPWFQIVKINFMYM